MAPKKPDAKKADAKPPDAQQPDVPPKKKTVRVTYANGKVEINEDDGRTYPSGTMLMWDADPEAGHNDMRWTVVGGGWPFDD